MTMVVSTKNQLGEFFINRNDWENVKNKSSLKLFFKHLNSQTNMHVTKLSIARSGTVYIDLGWGDFDADYGIFGDGDEIKLRFSDHACAYGKFSHDGRTENYTNPDYDITTKNHNDWEKIFNLSNYYA